MYKNIIFLINILIAIALMCSCNTGAADNAPVEVGFSVRSTDGRLGGKVVSVVNAGISDAKFYYKAVPNWSSSMSIMGATLDEDGNPAFKEFDNTADSLGYFAQGSWTIYVEIISVNDTKLYEGDTTVFINSATSNIEIEVDKVTGTDPGTIEISVTSRTVTNIDKLIITYGTPDDFDDPLDTLIIEDASSGKSSDTTNPDDIRTQFDAELELDPGFYWVKLVYNDGLYDVGSAMVCADVVDGEESVISGTVDSGEWQAEVINFNNIKTFGIVISAEDGASSVVQNTDLVFTCSKSGELSGNIASCKWYVDGIDQGVTGTTFTFNRAYDSNAPNGNFYRINCIASDGSTPVKLCAEAMWVIVVKEN